jgi:signal peptidase II
VPSVDGDARAPVSRRGVIVAVIVVFVVALDQATKTWAVAALGDGPTRIVGDIELRLSHNTGGAFSLFQGFTPLLAILAILLALALLRALRRTDDVWVVVALALVLGGAIGNLIDRVVRSPGFLRGAVIDFVSVGSFPTFNAADAAITVGAILLVVRVVFGDRSDDRRVEPSA